MCIHDMFIHLNRKSVGMSFKGKYIHIYIKYFTINLAIEQTLKYLQSTLQLNKHF